MAIAQNDLQRIIDGVKEDSGVTWIEDDNKIKRLANNAYNWFTRLYGNVDFEVPEGSVVESLLIERTRYAYNNSLDLFSRNYAKEIRELITDIALNDYVANKEG